MYRKYIKNKYFVFLLMFFVIHMVVSPAYYNAYAASKARTEIENHFYFTYDDMNRSISIENEKSNIELLEEKMKELLNLLEEDESVFNNKLDNQLEKLSEEIKLLDKNIIEEFSKEEALLRQKNVSSKILARHFDFLNEYQEKMNYLIDLIDRNIKEDDIFFSAFSTSRTEDPREELRWELKENFLQEKYILPELDDLPVTSIDFEAGEPGDYQSITPAFQATMGNFQVQSNYQVQANDLQETIEIQFTPEIRELARDLDHNPVKIYEYIRNNFDYEPYYGSVRGSQETLRQRAGNDFDLSSLLIALYRESNIPSRYVTGVVRIPVEKVKQWVGIDDTQSALNIFPSNGIPSRAIVSGGEAVYLELEHTWVEAYLPLANYRGVRLDESGKGWVPLDSAFKLYETVEGVDFAEKITFSIDTLTEDLEKGSVIGMDNNSITQVDNEMIDAVFKNYKNTLRVYLEENHSEERMIDILPGHQIIKEEYSILPLSLPYEIVITTGEMDSLSDKYREKLNIQIEGDYWSGADISYTAAISELLSKTISLSYIAATDADSQLIKSYIPEIEVDEELDINKLPASLPAYLIQVKPKLTIDDKVIAVGSPVTLGSNQNLNLNFIHPIKNAGRDNYKIVAGESYVINLNNGRVNGKHLDDKIVNLRNMEYNLTEENFNKITSSSLASETLHTIGMSYYAQVDMINKMLQQQTGIRSFRMTSAGLTKMNLNVEKLFGMPRLVRPGGMSIDLAREAHNSWSVVGDENNVKAYNMVSGMMSSYMEGSIFSQMFGGASVSTMHVLQYANKEGIPIFTINSENYETVLEQLEYSHSKKQMFRNFILNGKSIIVPQREVTISDWTGTGYIVQNEDGSGAYMISGGLNGGVLGEVMEFAKELFWFLIGGILDGTLIPGIGIIISFGRLVDSTSSNAEETRELMDGNYSNWANMFLLDVLIYFIAASFILITVVALLLGSPLGFWFFLITHIIMRALVIYRENLYDEYMSEMSSNNVFFNRKFLYA
ncbi:transglutaminase-like domain-containing protein [Natronospora cellulosivora (SeqCode)]